MHVMYEPYDTRVLRDFQDTRVLYELTDTRVMHEFFIIYLKLLTVPVLESILDTPLMINPLRRSLCAGVEISLFPHADSAEVSRLHCYYYAVCPESYPILLLY